MHRPRLVATVLVAATVLTGLVVGGSPAGADGTSAVGLNCQVPIVGSTSTSVDVTATDSADPIVVGGSVTNTVKVPVPALDDLPISVTVKEVKMTTPIPAGVTVTGVTFTPSSFTGKTWAVSGSNLVVTLTGSIPLSPGGTPPTVPEVRTATTVSGLAPHGELEGPVVDHGQGRHLPRIADGHLRAHGPQPGPHHHHRQGAEPAAGAGGAQPRDDAGHGSTGHPLGDRPQRRRPDVRGQLGARPRHGDRHGAGADLHADGRLRRA